MNLESMRGLPDFFRNVKDPRRTQGKRHSLSSILAIIAGATLCGMKGYKGISDWAQSLGQKARERFKCYYKEGQYLVPSEYVIRDILVRVDPECIDKALQAWNAQYGEEKDDSLAIDGKTMCNAIDKDGRQSHIMSAIGHDSQRCYTQKK